MISLDDLGRYAKWIFDNPEKSDGLDLEVATADVTWDDIVSSFQKVTGKKAMYEELDLDTLVENYAKGRGLPLDAPVAFAPDAVGAQDNTTQTLVVSLA